MNLNPPTGTTRQEITEGYKRLVLLVISIGTAMTALDTGVVNVAYPQMTRHFNVPITTITWVSLAYLIASSASIVTWGRLADILGRKWIYLGGLVVFTFGSLLSSLAPNALFLIGSRGVQGLGAAMALANSIALISEVFPANQRGMAIGVLETAVAVALTLGPTIGGFLISLAGWQAIFFINLPIGAINVGLGAIVLRNIGERKPKADRRLSNLDLPGTLLFGGAVALLVLVITQGEEQGWLSLFTLGLLVLSLIFFGLFSYRETHTGNPAIDLRLFLSNRAFTSSNGAKLLGYSAFFAINFLTPFYLDQQLKFEPQLIGLGIVPYTAALGLGSFASSILVDRFSSRWMAALGLGLVALGLAWLGLTTAEAGYAMLAPALALSGVGMGLFITPNDKTTMNAAPRDRLGVAASALALFRILGMISGGALASTLYSLVAGGRLGVNFNPQTSRQGFHAVFWVECGLVLLGVLLVLGFSQSSAQNQQADIATPVGANAEPV